MARIAMVTVALTLLATGSAQAAGPGELFPTGGLPLPPGAIAGGNGGYSDGSATTAGVSQDGRYVAFAADADGLSAAAHPDVTNVFRKDRATGAVVLVSRASGENGAVPARLGREVTMSDDGSRVAWVTRASLDPADTDDAFDVYVRDIPSATTLLASPGTTDSVHDYDLSGDGAYVAFATSAPLAGGSDANGVADVYRRRLADGAIALVSRKAGSALAGGAASSDPSISDDGRWVAFASAANDLVGGFVDGGASTDVFARDVTGAVAYLVSQGPVANSGANAQSGNPQVAGAPGALLADVFVAYDSDATNLSAADASGAESVYRRRLSQSFSVLVSRADGFGGANADSRAHVGGISDSGARIAFASDAGNLTPAPDYYGAYVRDVGAGTTSLASVDTQYAVEPMISGDGALVAWLNGAGGITPDSDPDLVGVFARTVPGGTAEYVSRPPGSAPFLAPVTATESAGTGARTISADGRYVVFAAYSSHLPGSANGPQVFRRDTLTGALELASRAGGADGVPADKQTREPSISADGTRVAFSTRARLVPEDADDLEAVYVRDLAAGTTTLASRADGAGGALPDGHAFDARIGAAGRHVMFVSAASNLGAPGGDDHVYLRDLATGRTQLVDRATGAEGAIGNGDARTGALSGDGRTIVFSTAANNIDPADPAPATLHDVYVRDTVAQTTALVSRRSGHDGAKATGSSSDPALSTDGRVVAFRTADAALAPEGGAWAGQQIVARDLASAQNTLVSRAAAGAVADAASQDPSVNADGSVIAFASAATNLIGGVGGGTRHGVFARAMATGALSGPPAFGLVDNEPQNRAVSPSISDDGRCLAFHGSGHNAFTGTAGDFRTEYVFAVSGECPKPLPPAGATQPPAGGQQPRPAISDASMKRKRFRVGKRPTKRVLAAARRARAGTAFRFRLSAGAEVTIALQQRAAGKRVGKSCRKPAPKLRKRKTCVRYVKRGALVRGGLAAGKQSIAFSGRVGRKALRPGRYRATLIARNEGGASEPVRLAFRVVKR